MIIGNHGREFTWVNGKLWEYGRKYRESDFAWKTRVKLALKRFGADKRASSYGANAPAFWVDQIAAVSLSTSTAKTKLGGTQVFGTGADYLMPGDARGLLAVRPKMYGTTPTANQASSATLKIESADLHLGDFEVFATPLDSGLGTAENQYQDTAPIYPTNFPCYGGERVQFYGTPQVANTVAIYESVDVFLSSTQGAFLDAVTPSMAQVIDYSRPVQGKIAGINYGGGPTSTGTAAGTQVFDGGVNISAPQKLIKAFYGLLVGTTPGASKPVGGQFAWTAGELVLNPQRWNAEPITGFLGTTTASALNHLSKVEGLNIRLKAPSFVKGSFTLDIAITTLCNFEVGSIYQDAP